MPANDLALLISAAEQAGEIAQRHHGGALDIMNKPQDNSPVTNADLEVNALLETVLRGARPDYGWLSEESTDGDARLGAERVFVVDPIDGTRSFIQGDSTWAHSLAIVHKGQVETAVVFLPMKDRMYSARRGAGAYRGAFPIAVAEQSDPNAASALSVKHSMDAQYWPGGVPSLKRSHRPSLAYRLSLVAEGRYDTMFTFRPSWEWDIAAGSLILSEAGARVTDRLGAPLRFNNPHPQTQGVVAANPTLHAALLDRLL